MTAETVASRKTSPESTFCEAAQLDKRMFRKEFRLRRSDYRSPDGLQGSLRALLSERSELLNT